MSKPQTAAYFKEEQRLVTSPHKSKVKSSKSSRKLDKYSLDGNQMNGNSFLPTSNSGAGGGMQFRSPRVIDSDDKSTNIKHFFSEIQSANPLKGRQNYQEMKSKTSHLKHRDSSCTNLVDQNPISYLIKKKFINEKIFKNQILKDTSLSKFSKSK